MSLCKKIPCAQHKIGLTKHSVSSIFIETYPLASAISECTFSTFGRLKKKTLSTRKRDCLNNCLLIHCHKWGRRRGKTCERGEETSVRSARGSRSFFTRVLRTLVSSPRSPVSPPLSQLRTPATQASVQLSKCSAESAVSMYSKRDPVCRLFSQSQLNCNK